ncbi:hypothetical protein AK812_SmicGene41348 [Symbiodinium microadriaticum]|uniref:Uncharacterized protein n=1 Tax=Symbiodinium microadriaticum TaxID=2951 RepID=A0A1Q9C6D0_SYMMI|nr:hypothetical protein AK812_SmicGene41348 [Symbiodinium microadriaticum]
MGRRSWPGRQKAETTPQRFPPPSRFASRESAVLHLVMSPALRFKDGVNDSRAPRYFLKKMTGSREAPLITVVGILPPAMGKRRCRPPWAKESSKYLRVGMGVLPGECLDQTSADGRFPTGTTVQKEQFVYVPHIDTAAAGVFKGSALRQQKDQVPFSLFEWADPQKQKQEAPKVLRSICTRPASSAARSTAPSTARSSLKAAGSEVLNPSLAGVAVQGAHYHPSPSSFFPTPLNFIRIEAEPPLPEPAPEPSTEAAKEAEGDEEPAICELDSAEPALSEGEGDAPEEPEAASSVDPMWADLLFKLAAHPCEAEVGGL